MEISKLLWWGQEDGNFKWLFPSRFLLAFTREYSYYSFLSFVFQKRKRGRIDYIKHSPLSN